MALYYYSEFLQKALHHEEFDLLYSPGTRTSWSGIYKCYACGHEIVHTHDKPLPPQNHHMHKPGLGPIQWRIAVTDHNLA
jgi:hypothetical protein